MEPNLCYSVQHNYKPNLLITTGYPYQILQAKHLGQLYGQNLKPNPQSKICRWFVYNIQSSETVVVISFKYMYNLISAGKGSTIFPQHLLLMSADVGNNLCCSNLQRLGSELCPYDLMLGQFLAHKWFLGMFQIAHILKIYTRKETISLKKTITFPKSLLITSIFQQSQS